MKYSATIVMSLLLLGVCSARTLGTSKSLRMDDDMKRKDDNSKEADDDRREEGRYEADDQKSQQMAQLKETVQQKIKSMYHQLTGSGNSSISLDNLPTLADPVEIGSAKDKYSFGSVSYDSVQFTGLRGANQADLNVNWQSQEATVTLDLQSAKIRGSYEASDSSRKTSGDFTIKMSNDVTYTCTYSYRLVDGSVQLQHSSGQLQYESFDSNYENNGFFSQAMQNVLGRNLMKKVNEKVHQELYSKWNSRIQQLIESSVQNQGGNSAEKAMREGIRSTINEIQQAVSKQEGFSIDLTSDDRDMVHNKLHARIASVKLNNVEKFYMAKNQVSNENSDKIRAKVELAIDRPTATAMVTLHEAHDEDAPYQKINVNFDMEDLKAELSLDKPTRQSGLELRSVKTSLNRIRPMDAEKFEGRISFLIKEKMASHMRRYVEEGLKNFIHKELSSIMGVQSRSRESSARNQM